MDLRYGKFRYGWTAIVVAAPAVLILLLYYHILLHPDVAAFGSGSDATRTYYTLYWYVNYNQSWFNFEGMNYPFGESIFYMDANPLVCFTLRLLKEIFPAAGPHAIAIYQEILLLNLWAFSLSVYGICRRFRVKPLFSLLLSLMMLLCFPMWMKVHGHMNLAFTSLISGTFYFLLSFGTTGNKRYLFFLAALIFAAALVHPYLGVICLLPVLVGIVLPRPGKKKPSHIWVSLLAVLSPLPVFMGLVKLTDHHTGRSGVVHGMTEFYASPAALFVSPSEFVQQHLYGKKITGLTSEDDYIYTGIMALLIVAVGAIYALKNKNADLRWLFILVIAAVPGLLFAFSTAIRPWAEFLRQVPVAENFRYASRFGFPFSFITVLAAGILITDMIGRGKKKFIAIGTGIVFFAIYSIHGILLHTELVHYTRVHHTRAHINPVFTDAQFMQTGIDPGEYDVILPLPFFNHGSNNADPQASNGIFLAAVQYSAFSGLPMAGGHMIRMSEAEALMNLGYTSPSFIEKSLAQKVKTGTQFLLLTIPVALSPEEEQLLQRCTHLADHGYFSWYTTDSEHLFLQTAQEEISGFISAQPGYEKTGSFYHIPGPATYFYRSFDDQHSELYYQGGGALRGPRNIYHVLLDIPADTLLPETEYMASFWIYHKWDDGVSGIAFVQENDTASGNITWISAVNPNHSRIADGDWTRVNIPFRTGNTGKTIQVCYKGPDTGAKEVVIDEAMVWETGKILYRPVQQRGNTITVLQKNNDFIRDRSSFP